MKTIINKIYHGVKIFFMDIVVDVSIFLGAFLWSLFYWTGEIYQTLGLGIACVSFILRILSRIHLGKNFSVNAQAKKLVTNGIYSKIRNPIYIFSLLSFTGVLISLGKPRLCIFLFPFLGMEIRRASKEKDVLYKKFGEEYQTYRKKTWF